MTLTARHMDALRFIRGYQLAKGFTPSIEEIAVGAGMSRKSKARACEMLDELESRGRLYRLPNRARAIEVLTDIPIPRDPEGTPLYFVRLP